jgi:hypothetical protein
VYAEIKLEFGERAWKRISVLRLFPFVDFDDANMYQNMFVVPYNWTSKKLPKWAVLFGIWNGCS